MLYRVSGALALIASLATAAHALRVGYYDMTAGSGQPWEAPPIVAAGHVAVPLDAVGATDIAPLDVLFVVNEDNGSYAASYLAHTAEIANAVNAGLVLVIHDRLVDGATSVLPGSIGLLVFREPVADIDVHDN